MAILAAYIAGCIDHRHVLAPGEVGRVHLLAKDKEQAGEAFDKTSGAFEASPALRKLIESQTSSELTFKNHVSIRVQSASFRGIRGATSLAVICDEISYWRSEESAAPDVEILNAAKPGLMTTGGPLICIGSPYARRGAAYRAFTTARTATRAL
jgi:phage terminase large subunit-like protein